MNNQNATHLDQDFLININQDLNWVIEVATEDFQTVNNLIRQYYSNILTSNNTKIEEDPRVELIVSHLQFIDIFKQRVEHLIQVHEQLIDNTDDSNFKESFFHLHVFQSLTIELDLLGSLEAITGLLEELRNHFIVDGKIEWRKQIFFSHTAEIKLVLKNTISQLQLAGGDTAHLPIPPLNPEQVRKLNSLYSMESERIVLSWFLEFMPHGTWAELVQHYPASIHGVNFKNIELF